MINYDVPINYRGNNDILRGNVLDDKTMLSNGFIKGVYRENLGYEITLTVKVSDDGLCIDVIDEEFLQPYDYQRMLMNNSAAKIPLEIHRKVQATMDRLSNAGIIKGWVINDYI